MLVIYSVLEALGGPREALGRLWEARWEALGDSWKPTFVAILRRQGAGELVCSIFAYSWKPTFVAILRRQGAGEPPRSIFA